MEGRVDGILVMYSDSRAIRCMELPVPKERKTSNSTYRNGNTGKKNEINLREGQRDLIHLEENS